MSKSNQRILITRRWPEEAENLLRKKYDVVLNTHDNPLSQDQFKEALTLFDAVCPTVTDTLNPEILSTPFIRTRILANYGAGVEHIDLKAAQKAGLVVTNTPDVLTQATAEVALLLMLMAARRATEAERELRSEAWTGWRPTHLIGRSLEGRHLGLIGFGRIAQSFAAMVKASFGMQISYHSRRPLPADDELRLGARYWSDIKAMAAECDVLSLHCPGGEATRHLVNRELLLRMPSHAILINTARGSVVDEAALAEALREGWIGAAGLDVFQGEPNVSPVLLAAPNITLLPHIGSATEDARTAMGLRAIENLDQFFAGEEPRDRVV